MFIPDTPPVSESLRQGIAERIKDKKPLVPSMLAHDLGVSELEASLALPEDMRCFATATRFDEIWNELTTWQSATFIMQHLGTVLEIKGTIPAGSHGHGYFNLKDGSIGGHLKVDDLKAIGFMSMPFMGLESHSIQFFNMDGAIKFSIYVGRENRQLIPSVRESFTRLREAACKDI